MEKLREQLVFVVTHSSQAERHIKRLILLCDEHITSVGRGFYVRRTDIKSQKKVDADLRIWFIEKHEEFF